ncbi:MAG TPA: hypothetical protein GXX54_08320 [Clostridiales bacterium]|nr:hypothetical protein [Clostridiales bacterium]
MFLSLVSIALMALMFLYMNVKAHFTKTRRMALIPLFCAVTEIFTLGAFTTHAFPVLSAISVLLRALILVSCWLELCRDELAYKKQVKRLQRQAAKPAA